MANKTVQSNTKSAKTIHRTITSFLDNEYTEYTKYVLATRALPSVVDGFKTGARKVMHAAFTGSLKDKSEHKLLNLTGDTFNKTYYAHGDMSLNGNIIGLGQHFHDNLNPLHINGQSGSLRDPNAVSAPRYLYVKLNKYADLYKVDYDLLDFVFDEGEYLEPIHYLPIIPVVLTNRAEGMAPGYKFSTMSYNPIDIIKACKEYLSTGKIKTQIRPYIPTVKSTNWSWDKTNKCWINVGEWKYMKTKDIMSITDLPYDIDFDTFEKMLNKYAESGYIKDWKNFSQGTSIHYDIHFAKGALTKEIGRASVDTKLPNKFKLIKKMPDDLLWVLDENGKVKHFDTVNDLIIYFVDYRLKKYDNRKDRLVKVLNERLKQNSDMCKFIELVITGKVEIRNKKRADIKDALKPYNLPDTLLITPMSKLTKEEYDELLKQNEDIKKELQYVIDTTTRDMYLNDLASLNKTLKDDFND